MNDRSIEWLHSKINEYDLYLLDDHFNVEIECSLIKVADTIYGIEAFEYYDLKFFGVQTVFVTDMIGVIYDSLFVRKNFPNETPKKIEFWVEMYLKERIKERRDKLARIAGLDPEQLEKTPTNRPKM